MIKANEIRKKKIYNWSAQPKNKGTILGELKANRITQSKSFKQIRHLGEGLRKFCFAWKTFKLRVFLLFNPEISVLIPLAFRDYSVFLLNYYWWVSSIVFWKRNVARNQHRWNFVIIRDLLLIILKIYYILSWIDQLKLALARTESNLELSIPILLT